MPTMKTHKGAASRFHIRGEVNKGRSFGKGIKRGEYGVPTKTKFLWGENPL